MSVELVLHNGFGSHSCATAQGCGVSETVSESAGHRVIAKKRVWPEPPGDDAPVDMRVAWMEQCAAMFDETAVNGGGYGLSQRSAVRAAEYMRLSAKGLAEGLGCTDGALGDGHGDEV